MSSNSQASDRGRDRQTVRIQTIVGLTCVALGLAANGPQAPPQTFRTGVEGVVLDVSILDKDRRPVRGLLAADFTILEDGKPQAIRTFKAVDLEDVVEPPPPARWAREVAPDVRRNDEFTEHRVVVIVLDSSTPMRAADVLLAKRLGWAAIDQLAPDDLAAVVHTFNHSAGQVFTKDRARLRASVDRFNGTMELDRPFNEYDRTAETMYRHSVDTLKGIAESMADLPERRKALILVSVGLPLDVEKASQAKAPSDGDVSHQIQSLYLALQDAIAAALRGNVSVYSADPGGLRTLASPLNHDFLKTVSNITGGFALVDTNDPAPGIAQIYRENSSYYILGYEPSARRAEGRFRRIEVRVNQPDVTVRTRNGYVEPTSEKTRATAPAASGPPPLTNALLGVVPMADIPLQMTAAAFARAGDNQADVAIAVGATEVVPVGTSATSDDVDVLVNAYDMKGELRASERFTVRLAFGARGGDSVRYGVLSRVTLNPGRYQLRLVARSSLLGRSGSVYFDLDVPDFSKSVLSLSGAILEVTPPVLSAPKAKLSPLLPVLPTAQREFTAGEQFGAFLRVYQGGKGTLSPVVVTTRIVDGNGKDVFSRTDTLGQDRFGSARAADYRVSLPVASLARGPYLVSMTATRGTLTAKREVRITLR